MTLVEQAPALTEVGAGLQVAPNGARVLDALGVEVAFVPGWAVHLIDGPSGRSILRMPLREPFRLVHRADLVAALEAVARRAGVAIRLGAPVAAVEAGLLRLAGGDAVTFDRLVGADGVRGTAAAYVTGGGAAPAAFTGQVAWRTVIPLDDAWPEETQVHVGPGRHLVAYPLRGGRRLNVVAVVERRDWVAEGWSHRDDPDALRRAFAGYAPGRVRDALDRARDVHLWGLMAHGARPRWRRGGVALIGDAAHPTLPFLAQGANLALEDAWTFAAMWDDPAGWEAMRRPRVARALRAAAGNARNYHLTGLRRALAHAALRAVGAVAPAAPLRRYRWLYDHDPVAMSAR